ncbi:silent information regulator family protein [Naegleria gruberi]|uniref:Silent information regulator family protein n=1 Tax=Naegleria gruberi TaxID=5762 RepID=D2VAB4_NAEGR|nr:silent information regulator family protein [Naegleria gruberi]EFC46279.1 silent information regulator family protein [Naegleria gruberi]|eukprot:XP_002679023.1 silent information regulator family protein [Naegleria gruberi strain NEG-M]
MLQCFTDCAQNNSSSSNNNSVDKNSKYQEDIEFSKQELNHGIEVLAEKIRNIDDHSIVVLTGAGLSTASGIPDFRTPGKGLFVNGSLEKFNLPDPMAIFDSDYFQTNPEPFFELTRDFVTTGYKPSKAHYFLKLLEKKNKLLRLYTQNIDGLETKSGISKELLVNCHGMYDTAKCQHCKKEYLLPTVIEKLGTDKDVKIPKCDDCGNVIKPDIVMYSDDLPEKYFSCLKDDLKTTPKCQLFICIGTSLSVMPVCRMPYFIPEGATRVLINRERCGVFTHIKSPVREIHEKHKHLDLFLGGKTMTIDQAIEKLAKALGWKSELNALVKKGPIDLLKQSQ